ncbi:putative transposase-like DNA-binding protein [Rhodococcus sp. SMB37]|nr:putative transposase-like DNA-binding protein [Rhodococcus sp. SMB37]
MCRRGYRGWSPHTPSRRFRTLTYRDTAIASLSARFDAATGHIAAPAGGEVSVPSGFARGVRRQLVACTRRSGEVTSDTARPEQLRITDIQPPPQVSAMARLAAADKQLAELTVTADTMVLTVKLPTEAVPAGDLSAAMTAVGVDWSPATLGAAAIVTDTGDGLVSDLRGYTYDDRGLGIKLARLQTEGQFLHRKAARLARLAENAPPQLRAELEGKIALLDENRVAVGVERGKINRELAFHFARQATDYAVAAAATVIAIEDLATLEPRGHGRVNNNRAARSARRKAADALTHTAARVGAAVVTVPARGSSSLCPGCNEELARPQGYHDAWCGSCQLGGNRDHVAGVNLAARGLLGRGKAVRTRTGSGDPHHRACAGAPVSGQVRPYSGEAAASPCPP